MALRDAYTFKSSYIPLQTVTALLEHHSLKYQDSQSQSLHHINQNLVILSLPKHFGHSASLSKSLQICKFCMLRPSPELAMVLFCDLILAP